MVGAGVKVTTNEAVSSTVLLHGLSATALIVRVTEPAPISFVEG